MLVPIREQLNVWVEFFHHPSMDFETDSGWATVPRISISAWQALELVGHTSQRFQRS
jgi:hypothetical protein